jgi:hypothetical protein
MSSVSKSDFGNQSAKGDFGNQSAKGEPQTGSKPDERLSGEEKSSVYSDIQERYLVSKALMYGTLHCVVQECKYVRKLTNHICSILIESATPPLTVEEAKTKLFRVCQVLVKRNIGDNTDSTHPDLDVLYRKFEDDQLIMLVQAETKTLSKYNKRLDDAAELLRTSDDSLVAFAKLLYLFM